MNEHYQRSDVSEPDGESVIEFVRKFDDYNIRIREYTNYYGGKRMVWLEPKKEEEVGIHRMILPTIQFFATGASVEEIESAMIACYEAVKHIRLKVL